MLRLRRELGLGSGTLTWLDSPKGVLMFENAGVLVVINVSGDPVAVPAGREVLVASAAVDGEIPENTAAWLR